MGTADPVDQELIDATDAALTRGIEAARIGNKMGDLAYAIGGEAKRLVIAIEPMLILGGSDDYYRDDDQWTLRSASGRRAAHSERTVAITADGPVVLTLP